MRWDTIVPAVLTVVEADSDVQFVLGNPPELWEHGERKFSAPSLQWQLISNGEGENYETTILQFSQATRSKDDLATLERALRRLLHHDTPVTFGGHELWSELVPGGGGPVRGASDGIHSRRLDFRLEYLRGRYAA